MNGELVVPISALEHFTYCPRQCGLIHVDGLWRENRHTVRGRRVHRRVDTGADRTERGRRILRGLPLYSETYGLVGRADVVEVTATGDLIPVEYKGGVRHGRAADVQLCAQALCLEEMFGSEVRIGFVWYAGWRRRRAIEIDTALRSETVEAAEEIRRMMATGALPSAVDDARCTECQLEPVCLPKVVFRPDSIQRYLEQEVFACG